VARQFLQDKPDERIEIAIPQWRTFRTLSPLDQLSVLLRALLKEEPSISGLADFVRERALKTGGMAMLAPRKEEEP
jgi:hypothetical protein